MRKVSVLGVGGTQTRNPSGIELDRIPWVSVSTACIHISNMVSSCVMQDLPGTKSCCWSQNKLFTDMWATIASRMIASNNLQERCHLFYYFLQMTEKLWPMLLRVTFFYRVL